MNKKTENPENALTTQASEFFAPATIRSLFWRPRFRVETGLLIHTPFLFWLTSVAQPRRIAVLGADDGYAHFLFCQVADKSSAPSKVQGIGFWNDQKSGKPRMRVPEALAEHELNFYEEISDLRAAPDIVAGTESLRDDSIDLLFVDLKTFADDMQPGMEAWRRALRENALILLHGTNACEIRPRLKAALTKFKDEGRMIELRDGEGLSLVAIGDDVPSRLQSLLTVSEGSDVPPEIAVIFRRLGQSLAAEVESKALRSREKASAKALTETRQSLESVNSELTTLRQGYEIQARKLAETQSTLFDLKDELHERAEKERVLERQLAEALREKSEGQETYEALTASYKAARQEAADAVARAEVSETALEEQAKALDAALQETADAVARAETAEAALEEQAKALDAARQETADAVARAETTEAALEEQAKALDAARQETADAVTRAAEAQNEAETNNRIRFEETAALTRMLEEAANVHDQLQQSATRATGEVEVLTRMLEENEKTAHALEVEKRRLDEHCNALLSSTSWRITKPIRKVKQVLSGDG